MPLGVKPRKRTSKMPVDAHSSRRMAICGAICGGGGAGGGVGMEAAEAEALPALPFFMYSGRVHTWLAMYTGRNPKPRSWSNTRA